jgi:hypothetical protein
VAVLSGLPVATETSINLLLPLPGVWEKAMDVYCVVFELVVELCAGLVAPEGSIETADWVNGWLFPPVK